MKPRTKSMAQNKTYPSWNLMLKTWLRQHIQAFISSLRQYYYHFFSSILTTAVIGIALALPGGFYLLLQNMQRVTLNWDDGIQITAFLKPDIQGAEVNTLVDRLLQNNDIERIQTIDRHQALQEYRQLSGFSEAIDVLDANPLPYVLIIHPYLTSLTDGGDKRILDFIHSNAEVDIAQYDQRWVKRLYGFIEIFRRFVIIFSVFISFGVSLIVGNTIRMGIYNCRNEIEITKLFGGTDSFIRRPFLYSGIWYGLSGSFFSWLLLALTMQFLHQPISKVSELYASDFHLSGFSIQETCVLFFCGILLGLVGSWISVQRHIRSME